MPFWFKVFFLLGMSCESCGGPLGGSRDRICLSCAALLTIREDLRRDWGDPVLRNLGTDLLVSASRQVRSLRISAQRLTEVPREEAQRPEQIRSAGERRQQVVSPEAERKRKHRQEAEPSSSDETETPRNISRPAEKSRKDSPQVGAFPKSGGPLEDPHRDHRGPRPAQVGRSGEQRLELRSNLFSGPEAQETRERSRRRRRDRERTPPQGLAERHLTLPDEYKEGGRKRKRER